MHLDDETIERLRHGELAPEREASAREHVASCAECGRRADAAARDEGRVHDLLRELDHVPPRATVAQVAARARAGAGRSAWMRWAASILVAAALGGAAYAMPGSPLPGLLDALVAWVGGGDASESAPATPASPAENPAASAAGIAIVPGEALIIEFAAARAQSAARVTLTDGGEVAVSAPPGAATFSAEADRLVVENAGLAATFDVRIPRNAPRVEIRVAGRRIFLKEGGTIEPPGSYGEAAPVVLPLAPGAR
jgi:hypothetical protein